MFTKKLKYFEFGIHSDKGKVKDMNFDGYSAFESSNGYVFVLCDGNDELGAKARDIALERIRYFMDREYIEDPFEAVQSSLIYTGGYIYKHITAQDEKYKNMMVSCLCVLIRDNKIYYSSLGNCHMFFYTGKGFYQLTPETSDDIHFMQGHGMTEKMFLGNDRVSAPFVCEKPLVPLNGDMILMCTDGLYDYISEKNIKKIISDPMPVHTKASRLGDMANDAGGIDNVSVQIISFYNLDHNIREFVPAEQPQKKDLPKIAKINFTGNSLWNKIIIGVMLVIAGYLFYDMFLFNPRPSVDLKGHEEAPVADTLTESEPLPEERFGQTVNVKSILNYFAPADTIYRVKSGDTWGSIYRKFEVCSWFIRSHEHNTGKFDRKDDPVAGRKITIPLIYSANPKYNPRFYKEFTTDKVGTACQHAGEDYIEEFHQNLKQRYLKQE